MINEEIAKKVINDIRTYSIMSQNENYRKRLEEAYTCVKSKNVNSLEDFKTMNDLPIGAFTYYEITIFDRFQDEGYLNQIRSAIFDIDNCRIEYINNPKIGDELASFGTVGETPKREELINKGYIVDGLKDEEMARHFK